MARLRLMPAALLIAAAASAQEAVVRYDIDVTLDPVRHRLTGSQQVRWTNRGDAPTSELWWHLYLNAFSSDRTTFMRELHGNDSWPWSRPVDAGWGWIRITALALEDGTNLLPTLEFVRPDDGNPEDFTVAKVTLPRSVPPGSSVTIELQFEAQLPELIARTGHAGEFHMIGQWFPKLGVYRGDRGWSCHQYHAASEFFADFGAWRVTATVPEGWVVGATGVEVERSVNAGQQRVVIAADRIHDFAWCAAPDQLMAVVEAEFEPASDVPMAWLDRVRQLLGVSAAELELPPMHLLLVLPRSQLPLAERMLRSVRLAVAWLGLHYGPYPYPQLTVVSPPPTAGAAGGMEYPTLITTGASLLLALPGLDRLPWIEMVTVHELGHQYFQGMVASNETEEGWLDEGLTSYVEAECLEAIVRDGLAPIVVVGGSWARARAETRLAQVPLVPDQRSWRFRTFEDYQLASFDRTALALKTLEGLLGRDRFARAMRLYVEKYRYGHPTGDELIATFEEAGGKELGWFLRQAIRSDAGVDWAVLRVRNRRSTAPDALAWDGAGWQALPADVAREFPWNALVEVGRRGELVGPVEVALSFADGSRERRSWDGRGRWVRWTIPSRQELIEVAVDPDGVWAVETERADNFWREPSDHAAVRRNLWWLMEALQLATLIPGPWS